MTRSRCSSGARCMKLDVLVGELMHILPQEHREKLVEGAIAGMAPV